MKIEWLLLLIVVLLLVLVTAVVVVIVVVTYEDEHVTWYLELWLFFSQHPFMSLNRNTGSVKQRK